VCKVIPDHAGLVDDFESQSIVVSTWTEACVWSEL
jgi:hypothetical protein